MTRSQIRRLLLGSLMLLALAPAGMGFVVKQAYLAGIDAFNQNENADFVLTGEFDQGFWTSSSTTRLKAVSDLDPKVFVFQQAWAHGPIPLGEWLSGRLTVSWVLAVVQTSLTAWPSEWPEVASGEVGKPLMESTTRIYFDRSVALRVSVPAVKSEPAGFFSEGFSGDFEIALGATPSLSGILSFLETDFELGRRLKFDQAALKILATSSEKNFQSVEVDLGMNALRIEDSLFASVDFQAEIHRVDLEAIIELNRALSQAALVAKASGGAEPTESEILANGLPRVLGTSPRLEVSKLFLGTSDQSIQGQAELSVDGSDPAGLSDPFSVLTRVSAEASLSAHQSTVAQILDRYFVQQMVDTGQAEGFSQGDLNDMAGFMRDAALGTLGAGKRIVLVGEEIQVRFELKDGRLILNGERLGPEEVGQLFSPL
ncbi:MAG: hypothetical protein CL917_17405 [Deltaproteobacteria bacterium]|nr:hypothetical protein [Deltaproteobacteria bacterium]